MIRYYIDGKLVNEFIFNQEIEQINKQEKNAVVRMTIDNKGTSRSEMIKTGRVKKLET